MYYFIFFIVFIIVGLAVLEFIFWSFEKAFNCLEEYFFPTPELPDEILDAIEQKLTTLFGTCIELMMSPKWENTIEC